jgi:hypothetical protein
MNISCTVDWNDDDMLWNSSKEDGDVRKEFEKDEGTDFDSNTDW